MRIQAYLPIMLKRQKAILEDDSRISFNQNGEPKSFNIRDVVEVIVQPKRWSVGNLVIILTTYDLSFTTNLQETYTIYNLSGKGYRYISDKYKENNNIQIDEKKSERGVTFYSLIRDTSKKMSSKISNYIAYILLLILLAMFITIQFTM